MFADLLLGAVVCGIVLGGFYAAVSVGLAIFFGHARSRAISWRIRLVILGSFCVYVLDQRWGSIR